MTVRPPIFLMLLWMLIICAAPVHAQESGDSCMAQAKTPLERTYCKIVAANTGAALPSLQELRRNPEKTQRLLLRRPAQQAGIALPPESAPRPATRTAPPASAPVPSKLNAGPASSLAMPPIVSGSLAGCQLAGPMIRCGNKQFRLQGNLANSRLAKDALGPGNLLTVAEYDGGPADQAQMMTYVAGIYRQYIEAMLGIGLGASTMSFTKFYHTFIDASSKGIAFNTRLAAMFEFLKKDKATMGVQAHYNDALPTHLNQCMSLSDRLIVCDNVQQNWVYQSGL